MHQNAFAAGSVEANGGAPATAAKRSHDAAFFSSQASIGRAALQMMDCRLQPGSRSALHQSFILSRPAL
jgi:hypothetical protein